MSLNIDKSLISAAIANWIQSFPNNPIPDFDARSKTCCVWKKTYICIKDSQIEFCSLNLFQRIFRRVFGCYKETVIERDTLVRIKSIIADLLLFKKKPVVPAEDSIPLAQSNPAPQASIAGTNASIPQPDSASSSSSLTTPMGLGKSGIAATHLHSAEALEFLAKVDKYEQLIADTTSIIELNIIKESLNIEMNAFIEDETGQIHRYKLKTLIEIANSKITAKSQEIYREDGVPKLLFDPALAIATFCKEQKPIQDAKRVFESLKKSLARNTNEAVALVNMYLFKEILTLLDVDFEALEKRLDFVPAKIPCLGLQVNPEIQSFLDGELAPLVGILGELQVNGLGVDSSWSQLFGCYWEMSNLNERFLSLGALIRDRLLDGSAGEALVAKIRQRFLQIGGDRDLINQFLDSRNRRTLENRVFYHTILNADGSRFIEKTKENNRLRRNHIEVMLAKINRDYQAKANAGRGDCLFLSCQDLVKAPDGAPDWRAAVVQKLRSSPEEFKELVLARIRNDDRVPLHRELLEVEGSVVSIDEDAYYQRYCDWIAQDYKWGSDPELHVMSALLNRPVIVVQRINGDFDWSRAINLEVNAEPLIFINHSASHYEAMVMKVDSSQ